MKLKNIVVLLLVFTIIAAAVTTAAIIVKNRDIINNEENRQENNQENNNSNNNSNNTEITVPKEEVVGTKRNQKYNENDLIIVKKENTGLTYNEPFRISGLKNKEIENRINNDLTNAEESIRSAYEKENKNSDKLEVHMELSANFSNVLSVVVYGSVNYKETQRIYLNYDLTTGNKLELEDIFVPGTDIDMLAQNTLYTNELYKHFPEEEINENLENWENGKYMYIIGEIDEEQLIKDFLEYRNSNKKFYFSFASVGVEYGEDKMIYIELKKCLDKVDIYSKYVKDESIFERNDVGLKDLYVCTQVLTDTKSDAYYLIEDLAENARIDVRVSIGADEYRTNEKLKSIISEIKEETQRKKNELTKLAKENKDKYYFYVVTGYIFNYYDNYYQGAKPDGFKCQQYKTTYEMSMDSYNTFFEKAMMNAYNAWYSYTEGFPYILDDDDKEKYNIKTTEEELEERYKVTDNNGAELVE